MKHMLQDLRPGLRFLALAFAWHAALWVAVVFTQ